MAERGAVAGSPAREPEAVRPPGGGSSILFCCTQNSVRSPMAEGLLKQLAGTRFYVDSVGLKSREVDPMAVEVMGELGIDISRHRAKSFDQLRDDFYDLIITLSPEAHHRALEFTRLQACDVEYWPTFDPLLQEGARTQRVDAFREVRDGLRQRIIRRFGL